MNEADELMEEDEDPTVVLRELLEEVVDSMGLEVDVRVEQL